MKDVFAKKKFAGAVSQTTLAKIIIVLVLSDTALQHPCKINDFCKWLVRDCTRNFTTIYVMGRGRVDHYGN